MAVSILQEVRKADIADLLSTLSELDTSLSRYAIHYHKKRELTKQEDWTFGDLDDIKDKLRVDIIQSRHAYKFLQRLLDDLSRKYKGDALGFAVDSIINEISRWNLQSVRAKYACMWIRAFIERFKAAAAMGKNLNASPPRQNQLKRIFNTPYQNIKPASIG